MFPEFLFPMTKTKLKWICAAPAGRFSQQIYPCPVQNLQVIWAVDWKLCKTLLAHSFALYCAGLLCRKIANPLISILWN